MGRPQAPRTAFRVGIGRIASVGIAVLLAGACSPAPGGSPTPATASLPGAVATAPAVAGPVTSPSGRAASPPAAPATPSPATTSACTTGPAVPVSLPSRYADRDAFIAGFAEDGELIVHVREPGFGGGIIEIVDPATGDAERAVRRAPKATEAAATRQVTANIAANRDWVAWEEAGFDIGGPWTMWATDRSTGKVRRVQASERGAHGGSSMGWPSDLAILGDQLAWSAEVPVHGAWVERIYVADLRTHEVRRLDVEARYATFLDAGTLAAAVRVGTRDGHVLAVPATIAIADGTVTPVDGVSPEPVATFDAAAAGMIELYRVQAATEDDATSVAEVLTIDAAGTRRTFALPDDWSAAVAGTGYLAWSDASHLWILPTGASEPQRLFETDGGEDGPIPQADGASLYWRSGGLDSPVVESMVSVSCPQ